MLKKNLKNILKQKNISVLELARRTGVPKSNINAWLNGSSPNLEQLDRVAQFLETNIDFIAFGRNPKDLFASFVNEFEIHAGTYEIKIKKIKIGE